VALACDGNNIAKFGESHTVFQCSTGRNRANRANRVVSAILGNA
jgi:hypothetical protein